MRLRLNSLFLHSDTRIVRLYIILSCLFLVISPVWSQETPASAGSHEPSAALSREFFGISLLDSLDVVKDRLKGHPYLYYRGDPDLSFVPHTTRIVIDSEGHYYVARGLLQFCEEKLYIMTLFLNPRQIDYYSLFTALTKRYGRPISLDPSAAIWQDGKTRLSLEKPLTFKYIDCETFDKLRDEGKAQKSLEEQSRQKFLDSF